MVQRDIFFKEGVPHAEDLRSSERAVQLMSDVLLYPLVFPLERSGFSTRLEASGFGDLIFLANSFVWALMAYWLVTLVRARTHRQNDVDAG